MSERIQLTYPLAVEFLNALRVPVATGIDGLNILALEGAKPMEGVAPEGLLEVHENRPDNTYNDTIALVWRDKDGGHVKLLKATTEPGRFYTEHPTNRQGAAHLVWGHHLYRRGRHHKFEALVSASGIDRVWRDRDRDHTQDSGEIVSSGPFGIHIHAGGHKDDIGRNSAGCLVIQGGYDGEPYLEFLRRIRLDPNLYVNVTLWGGLDFAQWFHDKLTWRPTLTYGIRNPWVARMQTLLKAQLDLLLTADGDWGARTQEAFAQFCEKRGLPRLITLNRSLWNSLEGT